MPNKYSAGNKLCLVAVCLRKTPNAYKRGTCIEASLKCVMGNELFQRASPFIFKFCRNLVVSKVIFMLDREEIVENNQ